MGKRGTDAQAPDASVSEEMRLLFGQNCAAARVKAGLSQRQVAELSGIPQPRISQIEQGKHNLTIETMTILARVVDHDLSHLLRKPRA